VPWDEPNVLLASNAIHQIGTQSFGWMRGSFPKKDGLELKFYEWLGKNAPESLDLQDHIKLPLIHRVERVGFAAYSLGDIFVPLVGEFSTSNFPLPHYIVSSIGPKALPSLIPFLTRSPPDQQTDLALGLIRLWGTNAFDAGPNLWNMAKTNQSLLHESRWLMALASTGYRSEELAKILVARIRSETTTPDYSKLEIWALARVPEWGGSGLGLTSGPSNSRSATTLVAVALRTVGRKAHLSFISRGPWARVDDSEGVVKQRPQRSICFRPSSRSATGHGRTRRSQH
jgi:hypothetical protein